MIEIPEWIGGAIGRRSGFRNRVVVGSTPTLSTSRLCGINEQALPVTVKPRVWAHADKSDPGIGIIRCGNG